MTSDSFIRDIRPWGKNFLLIDAGREDGSVHISHDCMTDDEIGEFVDDYYLCTKMQTMGIGESFKIDSYSDRSVILVRIS